MYSAVVINVFTDRGGVIGEAVGDSEGAEVGDVGLTVGDLDGASVGEFDGAAVGEFVLQSGETWPDLSE